MFSFLKKILVFPFLIIASTSCSSSLNKKTKPNWSSTSDTIATTVYSKEELLKSETNFRETKKSFSRMGRP